MHAQENEQEGMDTWYPVLLVYWVVSAPIHMVQRLLVLSIVIAIALRQDSVRQHTDMHQSCIGS